MSRLYFAFAHLSLVGALAACVLAPAAVGGFFYHPRMLAVVHLVTLGWITGSIIASLHLILPTVLRAPVRTRRVDGWVFGLYVFAVTGMASHFWLDAPEGMAWAALLLLLCLVQILWRLARPLASSPLPAALKAHFWLAMLNLLLAGALGTLIAFDKTRQVLPGYVLDHVFAHAHLAALGWATLMVMAAGHHLLPMLLPAAPPRGPGLWGTVLLLEAGVLGLAAAFLTGAPVLLPSGLLCLAAILLFLLRVRWMLAHRRPPPRTLQRPDPGAVLTLAALLHLGLASVLGGALLLAPPGRWTLPLMTLYGVAGLLGFLAQVILGVGYRLLPVAVWLSTWGGRLPDTPPLSPHEMPWRPLHLAVAALWNLGVPLLAAALVLHRADWLRAGAGLLLAAALLAVVQQVRVLHLAGARPPTAPGRP